MSGSSLRRQSGLEAVRSVLVGLVAVGLLGIVGALVSYRADVAEARAQVKRRVGQQGKLYADSLALHFDVLRAELQRVAERPISKLRTADAELETVIQDDRALFGGGVALVALDGSVVWSHPANALAGKGHAGTQWFQKVLETQGPTVDELADDDSSRMAVAVPVREGATLAAILVGVVSASDRLLYGVEGPHEQLLLLSSQERVLVPLREPSWSHQADFASKFDTLLRRDPTSSWEWAGERMTAAAFLVRGTSLGVLAIETEGAAVEPIRQRLNAQLAFLLVLQLVAVGAFFLFLRRTWRTFLQVEAKVAEQETLAALGSASSLIAHEVKNSLNGLKGATSLLEAGGDAGLVSRTVKGQVERLEHLASSLLSFGKPPEPKRVPTDVSALVRETVQSLEVLPEWPEAKVTVSAGEHSTLLTDPLLLATAVDNLVRNAVEAVVAAKDVGQTQSPWVTVTVAPAGAALTIAIEDDAGGPPPGFEETWGTPFLTSKPKGIGLGLVMARRAVAQLGGALTFTRTAAGSRFELHLPPPPSPEV